METINAAPPKRLSARIAHCCDEIIATENITKQTVTDISQKHGLSPERINLIMELTSFNRYIKKQTWKQ